MIEAIIIDVCTAVVYNCYKDRGHLSSVCASDSLLAAPRRCRRPFTRGRISAAVLPPVCEASEASEPSHQQYEVIRARLLEASATHCTTNLR